MLSAVLILKTFDKFSGSASTSRMNSQMVVILPSTLIPGQKHSLLYVTPIREGGKMKS